MPDLSYDQPTGSHSSWPRRQAIKIVLDVTRLVREGKLTPEQAEELKALASRDIGILAINILMSFGAIAVAAGILALNPSFATGAAIGVCAGRDRPCRVVRRRRALGPARYSRYGD